ncbi:hypothetical protein CANTEDRAFT_116658 [Yamadazyma tenuis ATCC 10573]|uniref:Uncharacterized protein n=1 Tax=Candida tenuis (strain ATCC 10573 / BCRC 21748 / CBS 615 / JCM 9827 / NBRC 10315 / NRRL Y-1498 / VKM Y-70) TaxID=590646 RepID=G3BES3_CANTC|nr:uncharacterized protein CANTEDRAFT_116658 [Yamadazyma tenuis ATCC 10573]XP_006690420.1 uncharacterized protein CANTEDRAFT_116658 [Yamadazyma tenuis ATCC 10573]EGV61205.1 hypothetical protein CANTEDRAFT_116658 [Yamadazyma tenuis ATCC 10573]EGV61206.1 hypothetical protein CANTEDRAFT_116658 [Yamadazyma tenuis ATCC 10573]
MTGSTINCIAVMWPTPESTSDASELLEDVDSVDVDSVDVDSVDVDSEYVDSVDVDSDDVDDQMSVDTELEASSWLLPWCPAKAPAPRPDRKPPLLLPEERKRSVTELFKVWLKSRIAPLAIAKYKK